MPTHKQIHLKVGHKAGVERCRNLWPSNGKKFFAGARQVAVRGTVCLSADALLRLTKGEEILAQLHQAQRIEEERSRKQGQNGGEKPV